MKIESPPPLLVSRADGIARLRFNRPDQLNTIDIAMAEAFATACDDIAADPAIRVVVLSGEGRGFGAGGDLSAFHTDADTTAVAIIGPMHAGVQRLAALDAPVLASLHGVVAGGSMSLAMACDLAIAAEGTRFNLAYVNIAANCDVSGSYHLPRLVGLRNAMGIALLGETFDASEALRLGLINKLVPADRLADQTETLVQKLAHGPTRAIGRMKRLLRVSLDNSLATQLDLEQEAFRGSAQTRDFAAALDAFFNKRKPVFEGR